jgi:UPF0716 protein FxsA
VLIRLSLLLIVVPLVELVLLLTLADVTGFTATLAILVGTALTGAWLLRRQGLRTLRSIRSELRSGRLPPQQLLDGLLILFAGAFLLTPGILTDLLGIALLVPRSRAVFRRWLVEYFRKRIRWLESPQVEILDSYVVSDDSESARHH